MRRKWRPARPKEVTKVFRANRQIRAEEVFLINEEGENVGVLPFEEALRMAEEIGLDLVEVNPKVNPPVVKIIDLGQLKYETEKKAHKQKIQQKKVELKGIRLSIRISEHDFNLRVAQAVKFLSKGNKLKIELVLKGREKQHYDIAAQMIRDFVAKLKQTEDMNIVEEQGLTKQGGRFNIILINKK